MTALTKAEAKQIGADLAADLKPWIAEEIARAQAPLRAQIAALDAEVIAQRRLLSTVTAPGRRRFVDVQRDRDDPDVLRLSLDSGDFALVRVETARALGDWADAPRGHA